MSAITFDTLKFAERLEKAGATREYAKAEVEALAEVFGTEIVIRKDLQIELAPIRAELTLIKWMVGLSLALSTGMIAHARMHRLQPPALALKEKRKKWEASPR